MIDHNIIDVTAPGANMYGCQPCPHCGGEYRVPYQDGRIECDDCGFKEKSVRPADVPTQKEGT